MTEKRYIVPKMLFVGSMIPEWLETRRELSPGCKMTYARLCRYSNHEGRAWPSQTTLAEAIGLKERQARTYVEECEHHGLIEIDQRGLGRTNIYLFPAHDWMGLPSLSNITQRVPDTAGPDRQDAAGQYIIVGSESINTCEPAAPAALTLGKKAKAKKAVHPDLGQWFGYSKAALSEKYPGYVFEPKQDRGLRLIFEKSCKSDLVKAKAFLQCALADGDRFVTNLRHDPMFLYSNANRWLTASRGWSGFKPELDSQKASREQAHQAQIAEQASHRREAEELERVKSDLSTLRPGDLETLRAAWLSTIPGDHIFRSKWAEADWRENPAVMAGIYGALKLRRKVNAGVLL